MAVEDRYELKEFLGSKVRVVGHYQKSNLFTDRHAKRDYETVCLKDCFVNDRQAMCTEHVWVHHAEPIKDEMPSYGELVEFTAVVKEYSKRQPDGSSAKSYYFDRPQDVRFPDRTAVAVRVREREEVPVQTKVNGHAVLPEPPAAKPAEALDYPAMIREVKAVAKKCGGLGRLKELVELLLED